MINSLKEFQKSNSFYFIVITILGLIAWLNTETFLWRDDWLYLSYYYRGDFSLFNNHLAFEIKPLFQYILFAEFYLAGIHFALYQVINVALLILGAICFFSIVASFGLHPRISLFISLIFLLHPINFVNAFWIFGQSELLHTLFLLISFLYFKKYSVSNKTADFLIFIFALLIQNYFFPNGILIPLLFVVGHFLFKENTSTNWKLISALVFVFILHVWHALYINASMPPERAIFSDILPKVTYFIKLIATSLYRSVIPNFKPQSQLLVNLIVVLALSIIIWITLKSIFEKSKRNLIILSLMGLIVSSVVLTLTRYNQTEIHYYYSTLQLPFILLILAACLDHYFIKKIKYIQWVLPLILIVFLFLDFKGKSIFVKRNKLNRQQMASGLSVNQYKPFDDPCFEMDDYFNVGQYTESESAVILYKWLRSQETFHPHENK